MSSRSVVCLSLIIVFSVNVNGDFCGNRRNFDSPKGIIETNDENSITNCTWFVKTPKRSVVYIKIEQLQLGTSIGMKRNERNCLHIKSIDHKLNFLNLCSETINFNALSIPTNELLISLEITSDSYLELAYTSYMINCTYDQLLCISSRFLPRKSNDNCLRGMLACDSSCGHQATGCDSFCYDIFLQRCDGILNCLNAEDELGCNPTSCPNGIQCSNDTKCLEQNQICDKKLDCKNGFDESYCPKSVCEGRGANCYIDDRMSNEFNQEDGYYVTIIILGVLAIIFLCVIFRCLASRQTVRALLNRPLDIPLPPFRGPGECSSTVEIHPFSEEDFKPGGEIYEGFIKNIERIKSRRKNILEIEEAEPGITFVKPPPGDEVLNKYFRGIKPVLSEELAALATLKISRDMCYGLRKTKSEERPMTKVLFIDNIDNEASDDSDREDIEGCSHFRQGLRETVPTKSDIDYIRRKNVEITIV